MHLLKKLSNRAKAFWHRNTLRLAVALAAAATILLFIVDYLVLNSSQFERPQQLSDPPSLLDLLVGIGLVTAAALAAVPLTDKVLTALRYRSRLDVMVRQSLLFVAGLIIAVLVFLTWTPIPRLLGITGMSGWQKLLTAGGVVTLTAAIVGLVISYRKQRDAEDDKFNHEFSNAANQLGHDSPAVRIAGIHTMATLADTNFLKRQRCIDVLCGHLRVPDRPVTVKNGLTSRTVREHQGDGSRTDIFTYLPGEREVRQSIVSVIRDRLQPDANNSWHGCDFNFTEVLFDGLSLQGAVFLGGNILFDRAHFINGSFNFQHTVLSEANVSFAGAEFRNADLTFDFMEVQAAKLSFSEAEFYDSSVSFVLAKFEGGVLNMDAVKLCNSHISFDYAKFSDVEEIEVSLLGTQLENASILRDGEDFHGYRWPPYGTS